MDNKSKEICIQITEIIAHKFDISRDKLIIENWSQPLTGELFAMSGIELLFLLFEIEKKYSIRVPQKDFKNYNFNSIVEISKSISKLIVN